MKIGIFGGTFDPVHLGHMEVAALAKSYLNLDKVIFVPAGCPQLKQLLPSATGKQRLEMVKIATGDNDRFNTSDLEINRKGPTFTIDTLKEMKEMLPLGTQLWLIIPQSPVPNVSQLAVVPSSWSPSSIPELRFPSSSKR